MIENVRNLFLDSFSFFLFRCIDRIVNICDASNRVTDGRVHTDWPLPVLHALQKINFTLSPLISKLHSVLFLVVFLVVFSFGKVESALPPVEGQSSSSRCLSLGPLKTLDLLSLIPHKWQFSPKIKTREEERGGGYRSGVELDGWGWSWVRGGVVASPGMKFVCWTEVIFEGAGSEARKHFDQEVPASNSRDARLGGG